MTGDFMPDDAGQPQPSESRAIVPLASGSCANVWGALAIAQGKFEAPKRTKEATVKGTTRDGRSYEYKYKYAPLDEIERSVREPLAANGLFRQQYLVSRGGQWFIRTIVGHNTGEWIASDYPVFASDNKNPAQAFASGVTYARRYGLSLALGICPEDDDDGQATAGEGEPIRPRAARKAAEPPPPPPPQQPAEQLDDEFLAQAEDKAREGSEPFRAWWRSLSKANRALLNTEIPRLQQLAADADARLAAERDTSGDAIAPEAGARPSSPATPDDDAPAEAMPVPMRFFTLHQALKTTAEGGPAALERLWSKQSKDAQAGLQPHYAEYQRIADLAVAMTP